MSSRFQVLMTDRAWPDADLERQILSPIGVEVVEPPACDEATLREFAREADAIATCWAPVTEAVIRSSLNCRVISRLGIGLDNIAVGTATELGIPVTFVPGYCLEEVADHTLALVLACGRKVSFYNQQAKRGIYDIQAGPPLRRLSTRVLGLIGFGRIGRTVYRKALGLGLQVLAHCRSGQDGGTGCPMVSLDELLERSDFVSLHLPSTEQTRHLLAERQFRRMRNSAFLINTSRGAIVDHRALWLALQQGELAGAALDVFDPEPPDLAEPIFKDPRVIVTPHAAFLSQESVRELRTRAARQVLQALQGLQPEHVVNPQIYHDRT